MSSFTIKVFDEITCLLKTKYGDASLIGEQYEFEDFFDEYKSVDDVYSYIISGLNKLVCSSSIVVSENPLYTMDDGELIYTSMCPSITIEWNDIYRIIIEAYEQNDLPYSYPTF